MKNRAIIMSLLFLPGTAWASSVMNVGPLVNILGLIFILLFGLKIIKALLKSKSFKGWLGEFQVKQAVTKQLEADTYREVLPNSWTGDGRY